MTNRVTKAALAIGILLSLGASSTLADFHGGDNRHGGGRNWEGPPARVDRSFELDRRYSHDHYYPPRGSFVDRLPRAPLVVPYRGTNYYFHGGSWYRPSGPRFVVVAPPIGLSISVLPPYYTTLWVGGAPYYYADGVYYNWHPAERSYVVVDPPRESEVVSPPPEPEQLFIYPKEAQSEQQQATDRYQCHRWAVDQTGFDPSQPGDDLAQSEMAAKRADYQRASKACLEARGYSVR